MHDENKRAITVCCQSGRILLMVPTATAVSTVALTTLMAEYFSGRHDYMIALQLFFLAVGLLVLMLPAFLASAFLGKPLCTATQDGLQHGGRCLRWMDMESMEYKYGYTRYYGDHTCIKLRMESGEGVTLKRAPLWLPLFAKRYTRDISFSAPHFKRHFLKGFLSGLLISAAVVVVYVL